MKKQEKKRKQERKKDKQTKKIWFSNCKVYFMHLRKDFTSINQ